MLIQLARMRRKQVLVDINTQRDYLLARGVACIRNHRRVLSHIRRMMAWARHEQIRIVSTCYIDANGGPEVASCHREGPRKVGYTLLRDRAISFTADDSMDLPRDIFRRYQQVILHKRSLDPFDEPRIDRMLSELKAEEYYLIGTTAEGAVQAAALGLRQRNKKVTVITDAVGTYNPKEAKIAFRKMEAKGAVLVETKKVAGTSHLHRIGICGCELCQRTSSKAAKRIPNVQPSPYLGHI